MPQDKISIIITLFVLSVLVLTSQTQAVDLGIEDMPENVVFGDKTQFTMFIDIKEGELVPVKLLSLKIKTEDGDIKTCLFRPDGKNLNQCKGIKVKRTYNVGSSYGDRKAYDERLGTWQFYGYGYGFGYGPEFKNELQYEVKMDTSKGFFMENGIGNYTFKMKATATNRTGADIHAHVYQSLPVAIEVVYPCERIRIFGEWIELSSLPKPVATLLMHLDKNNNCKISKNELS